MQNYLYKAPMYPCYPQCAQKDDPPVMPPMGFHEGFHQEIHHFHHHIHHHFHHFERRDDFEHRDEYPYGQ